MNILDYLPKEFKKINSKTIDRINAAVEINNASGKNAIDDYISLYSLFIDGQATCNSLVISDPDHSVLSFNIIIVDDVDHQMGCSVVVTKEKVCIMCADVNGFDTWAHNSVSVGAANILDYLPKTLSAIDPVIG